MTQDAIASLSGLDRQYVNGVRFSRMDEWTEKNILRTSATELEVLLEMQPCFVYRLSLAVLPQLAKRGAVHVAHVRTAIVQLLSGDGWNGERPSLDGAVFEWKSFGERMTRRAWLTEMLAAIDRLTGSTDASIPTPEPLVMDTFTPSAPTTASAIALSSPADWYLPELRPGQFQLPHLWTCGSLVQIGVRNCPRRTFGPDSPLHVVEFSGQSYGDTVVTYMGEELRTGDMEVWGQLLKLLIRQECS